MRRPPNHQLAKKLSKRFRGKSAETYFRFLTEPCVEPTNNASERQIRHTVIDRRITQGTRGPGRHALVRTHLDDYCHLQKTETKCF
jgi:hypothetical protein